MQLLPPALAPLGAWPQFVTWIGAPNPKKPGKLSKFPTNWRDGSVIDAHNAVYWTTAEQALAAAPGQDRGHGSGAGFVFTDADPFFFCDIDGAHDPATGWSSVAQELCARLAGAAVEVSLSGTGLHIIGRTHKPLEHAKKNTPRGLELYTSKRFVALTGISTQGDAAADCGGALAGVIADYFPPTVTGDWADWTHDPVEEYTGPADDNVLLAKMMAASARSPAAAFGGDVCFADLWTANAEALGRKWPPTKPWDAYDASSADMALANHLAWWTGKNCERIRTLMEQSALAREKWFSRPSYLGDTIEQACRFLRSVYSIPASVTPPPAVPMPAPEVLEAAAVTARTTLRDPLAEYMAPDVQLQHFAGCWFDNATDKIYSLARNTVFGQTAFNVNFGGHMFVLDPMGQKTTDKAWDAFCYSRINMPRIVDGLCFRPEEPPGQEVHDGRRIYVNSYVPYEPKLVEGDPTKFLDHLRKLLPVAEDYKIFLSWMASMAQNPGRKFQWWPVLQGAEGNGKSLCIMVLTHILGEEYTHLPNPHAMARDGNKFNSWIYRKLFIGVEEIMLSSKRDFLEEFKVVVTGERIPLEKKGQDQFTGDNRVNGILITNHKDGVPITTDGRRYSIFYCAQQEGEEWQIRDGMGTDYMADLVDWLKGRGAYAWGGKGYGCAVVGRFLMDMEIDAAYDPARQSVRAPKTSSTEEALRMSLGTAEQEILDAIEEGKPGFAGGWVSSHYLNMLLEKIRSHVPRSRRRAMMRQLGYDYHPVLRDGRVNDPVTPDHGRPRLFVRKGHPALGEESPATIGRLYSAAQERALAGTLDAPVNSANVTA